MQKDIHVVTIDGYNDVPPNNGSYLLSIVAQQPVSVAIEASGRDFQLYSRVSKPIIMLILNMQYHKCP
jgi:hypothetical protein